MHEQQNTKSMSRQMISLDIQPNIFLSCTSRWPRGHTRKTPAAVPLASMLTANTQNASGKEENKHFVARLDLYIVWLYFLLKYRFVVTRTTRDSAWTEGKPQPPPQHLSSMAAAMFPFMEEPVTSAGPRAEEGCSVFK